MIWTVLNRYVEALHTTQCGPHSPELILSLRWRHNERDGVSNHQSHDVYSTVYSRWRSKKYQSSASLAFVWGIHRGSVNSPHKGPVTRKRFPFDDVIMMLPCMPGHVTHDRLLCRGIDRRSTNSILYITNVVLGPLLLIGLTQIQQWNID